MNTELILYLWTMLPLHAVSHFVRVFAQEWKRVPSSGVKFWLRDFSENSWLRNTLSIEAEKKSQLCIIKIHFKNSFVALESTPRRLFMFTITLEETWRKQLPNLCSIHRLDENKHSEQTWGGLAVKLKPACVKVRFHPILPSCYKM